jgi:hypothetical protein
LRWHTTSPSTRSRQRWSRSHRCCPVAASHEEGEGEGAYVAREVAGVITPTRPAGPEEIPGLNAAICRLVNIMPTNTREIVEAWLVWDNNYYIELDYDAGKRDHKLEYNVFDQHG